MYFINVSSENMLVYRKRVQAPTVSYALLGSNWQRDLNCNWVLYNVGCLYSDGCLLSGRSS